MKLFVRTSLFDYTCIVQLGLKAYKSDVKENYCGNYSENRFQDR